MHNARYRILIVNAERGSDAAVAGLLCAEGYSIATIGFGEGWGEVARVVSERAPHLVLCEVDTGEAELATLAKRWPHLRIIALGGRVRARHVVRALRAGALHFVSRGDLDDLSKTVRRELSRTAGSRSPVEASPPMQRMLEIVEKVADTDVTVLLQGESGSGKEWVAERLCARSRRSRRPFVKVNCAALPAALLESELFGFEPGAFTGAHRRKLGKFELAGGGTLFLDEISEMSPALQAKLLQVLQDGRFSRLGAEHDVEVDVRILAATHRDLHAQVAAGTFREDLLYRLNVVNLCVPPLRARREEIPGLADQILRDLSRRLDRPYVPLSPELLRLFMAYRWPGNVRELENVLKRRVVLASEACVVDELARKLREVPTREPGSEDPQLARDGCGAGETTQSPLRRVGKEASARVERVLIERVLERTCWNRRRTAEILQVSYKALLYKMRDAGLTPRV